MVKTACDAGGPGLIAGAEDPMAKGNGYPFQNSCLENSMDRGTWQATVHEGCKESDKTERLTLSAKQEKKKRKSADSEVFSL